MKKKLLMVITAFLVIFLPVTTATSANEQTGAGKHQTKVVIRIEAEQNPAAESPEQKDVLHENHSRPSSIKESKSYSDSLLKTGEDVNDFSLIGLTIIVLVLIFLFRRERKKHGMA